jgi:hypothetical protein
MLESLWQSMNTGGFSPILEDKVLRFNGGLFADSRAIALDRDQLELLLKASRADWRYVEPAIFGTLLERALDPASATSSAPTTPARLRRAARAAHHRRAPAR